MFGRVERGEDMRNERETHRDNNGRANQIIDDFKQYYTRWDRERARHSGMKKKRQEERGRLTVGEVALQDEKTEGC